MAFACGNKERGEAHEHPEHWQRNSSFKATATPASPSSSSFHKTHSGSRKRKRRSRSKGRYHSTAQPSQSQGNPHLKHQGKKHRSTLGGAIYDADERLHAHTHDRGAIASSSGRTLDNVLSGVLKPSYSSIQAVSHHGFTFDASGERALTTVPKLSDHERPKFTRFAYEHLERGWSTHLHQHLTDQHDMQAAKQQERLRKKTVSKLAASQVARLPSFSLHGDTVPLIDADDTDTEKSSIHSDRMQRRTQELNALIQTQPQSEDVWIQLARHQDTLKEQLRTRSELASLAKKKRSILHKGLENIPESVELAEELIAEWERSLEPHQLIRETRQLISSISGSPRLWRRYLHTYKSLYAVFTVSSYIAECESAIQSLLDQRKAYEKAGVRFHDIEALDRGLIGIAEMLVRQLLQSGHHEAGIGRIQALLEYACFPPAHCLNTSEATKLRMFERFWQSKLPKIGHEKAHGWDNHTDDEITGAQWLKDELRAYETHQPSVFNMDIAHYQLEVEDHKSVERLAQRADDALQSDITHGMLARYSELERIRDAGVKEPFALSKTLAKEADVDAHCVLTVSDVRKCIFSMSSEPLQVELLLSMCRVLGVGEPSFVWQSTASETKLESFNGTETASQHWAIAPLVTVHGACPSWLNIPGDHEGAWVSASGEQLLFVQRLLREGIARFPYCAPLCDAFFGICQSIQQVRSEAKQLLKRFRNSVSVLNAWCKAELRNCSDSARTAKLCAAVASESPFSVGVCGVYLAHAQLQLTHGSPHEAYNTLHHLGMQAANYAGTSGASEGFQALLREACTVDGTEGISPLADSLEGSGLEMCLSALLFESFGDEAQANTDCTQVEKLAEDLLLMPREESLGMNATAEALHSALCNITGFEMHKRLTPLVPAKRLQTIRRALEDFPANPTLLRYLLQAEDSSVTCRRIIAAISARTTEATVSTLLARLRYEWSAGASASLIRSIIERALLTGRAITSPLVWRVYMALEASNGIHSSKNGTGNGRKVFLRAIQSCPGNKALWLDGFAYGFVNGAEANDLLDAMEDTGIICRASVYEAMLEQA